MTSWRTHSCVPRSHSCERMCWGVYPAPEFVPRPRRSHECERCTHECVRHVRQVSA